MTAFLVRWEIEVDAASPREAADLAVNMLPTLGGDSTATFFQVCPEDSTSDPSKWTLVDVNADQK